MADETKTVGDIPTDDELSKAFDEEESTGGDQEEVKADEASPEVKADEKGDELPEVKDQQESSKLGRKFKRMDAELQQLKTENQQFREMLAGKAKAETVPFEAPPDDETELEAIRELYQTDPVAATRRQNAYDRKKSEDFFKAANKKYTDDYIAKVNEISKEDDEDLRDEIIAELYKDGGKFNKRHSTDPQQWTDGRTPGMEAMVNYANTKAFIMQGKSSNGKRPGTSGGQDRPPAGPAGGDTRTAARKAEIPAMDELAADYVRYLQSPAAQKFAKVSDEDIAKVLK